MDKQVGNFKGTAYDPHPIQCSITNTSMNDDHPERVISFTHQDLDDLEYLIQQIKKDAEKKL